MKKGKIFSVLISAMLILSALTSCSGTQGGYVDGYYTAEIAEFDSHGWKEFVTICVNGGRVISVEYNAKNESGMIKSWDMNYMRVMNSVAGTYPNRYTRAFASNILKNQSADKIDAITGATHSYHTFEQLAEAVFELAAAGDQQIVFVTAEE